MRIWWVVLLVVACSKDAKSPPVPAESGASQQFAGWLAAFNTADQAKLLAYHEQHFPYDVASDDVKSVENELGLARGTGGFEVRKVEESTPTKHTVVMKEKASEQHARVSIEVEAAPPHKVTRFEIHPIPTPDDLQPKRVSEAEAIVALRAELDRLVARDAFSGAVLVAKHGKTIFAEAYGMADRAQKIKNTLDTKFRIGSMNKMFTAATTLRLVQEGKLARDTPLGKVLADYPNKQVATKVTIHHLLSHTGGTGDIFGPKFDEKRRELRTLEDYVKLYGDRELEVEPGNFQYSNYGFLLLGVAIAKVTGKSYYDAVEEHVFEPAGMTATASLPEDDKVSDRSIGYMHETGPWVPNTDTLPFRGTSAGGGYSTVGDLARFGDALVNHKLVDAAHLKLLTTGKVDMGPRMKYAYGFTESSGPVRCFGHSGGAPGMNGDLAICDSGYTIVVLANLDPPVANQVSDFIAARLPLR
ncbi:MAG: beta-lactamase family protein [Deltaproteobacteria bacterium]|nr:beta-lactamase family protein [Deltaproteobacteria bacterium]